MADDAQDKKAKKDTSHLVALPPGVTLPQQTEPAAPPEPDPSPVDEASSEATATTEDASTVEGVADDAPTADNTEAEGHDSVPTVSADSEPRRPATPTATDVEAHELRLRRLVASERRYLPMVGAMPIDAWAVSTPETKADGIRLFAPTGRWVHAVESGVVVDHTTSGQVGSEHLALRTPDGAVHHYHGLQPGSVSTRRGDTLQGGQPLGRVAAASQRGWSGIRFAVQLVDESWSNPYRVLVGLPDPAELVEAVHTADDPTPVVTGTAQQAPADIADQQQNTPAPTSSHLVADLPIVKPRGHDG